MGDERGHVGSRNAAKEALQEMVRGEIRRQLITDTITRLNQAGVTQLARVAALELAPFGVRVNTLHPDAVFDTEIWTEEALKKSADRYRMTVQEYKTKNLLRTEIKSTDIALMVSVVAGPAFKATTGAQIPIDGGNDRVI